MKRILAVWLAVLLTATVVEAFNISPFTYKLRSRATPADSAYIYNGTIYLTEMDSAIALVLKARNKLIADSLQGSGTATGILDSALLVDADSSAGLAIIWFSGHGAGIKWQRSTDSLYWTRDGSTWVNFGTGSGSGSTTTNADSLGHKIARMAYATNGYVLAFDHDSLYWKADATGAGADSDAVRYRADRYGSYSDTGIYIGDTGDQTMLWFNLTDTNIIAFVKVYYNEDLPDSALITWHTLQEQIAGMGGDITGIVTSPPLLGGVASGDANLSVDIDWFVAWLDSVTTATIPRAENADTLYNDNSALVWANSGAIYLTAPSPANAALFTTLGGHSIFYADTGSIVFDRRIVMNGDTIQDFTGSGLTVTSKTLGILYSWLYGTIDTSQATVLSVALGNGGTGGGSNGALTLNVVAGTSTGLAVNADSVFISAGGITTTQILDGTVALADHAANSVDSTKIVDGGIGSGDIGTGRITTTHILDGTVALADHASNSVDSTKIVDGSIGSGDIGTGRITTTHILDGTIALADHAANSVDSTKIVDGSIGSGDIGTGRITTTHILDATIASGDIATGAIDSIRLGTACVKPAEVDTAGSYVIGNLRTGARTTSVIKSNNFQAEDLDSNLKIGSGQGLILGSQILYGTDITDDTMIVDYYPEAQYAALADRIMPTYKDSMKIYGDVDSCGNIGNVLVFSDSLLNSGQHRRSYHQTISHPLHTDTLRYIIVYGLVKDSSGTNEMYLRGALRTTPWTRSCADSLAAGNVKDYDSLGGDFGDNQVVRKFVLTGGAVTAGGAWYLLITGRHDSGTAYNWGEVGLIRCVYSKVGPD